MKKVYALLTVLAVALLIYTVPIIGKISDISNDKRIQIFVVYNKNNLEQEPQVLEAYKSVLEEEGVPYRPIEIFELLNLDANEIVKKNPVIIFSDGISQTVPSEFSEWTKKYMQKGGNIAVIYDAGIKHTQGHFLKKAVFADIIGLNYINFDQLRQDAFVQGKIRFNSEENRDFFQIPYGKTIDGLTISGYSFGALNYPVNVNKPLRDLPEKDIFANAVVSSSNEKIPAIVVTDYGKGKVLYVNFPLGQLKTVGDDLPLRASLRTFLFDVVGVPHVMNVANAKGGVIINWHVDAAIEHDNIPYLIEQNIFDKDIDASFHITAGDFLNQPGDDMGFKVDTVGRPLTEEMMDRGTIGSHGGWAHNWFAFQIQDKKFGAEKMREYIIKNNEALEKVTGYKIREYSAPTGVHPQPDTTKILEDLNFIAYYTTSDTGSAPHRGFYNGKMVSAKVIAFPVMPFGKAASLWEMNDKYYRSPQDVQKWLSSILDYAKNHKTVRMMYSHPVDIHYFEPEIKTFMQKAKNMNLNNEVNVNTMTKFAEFFLRFLQTEYSFVLSGDALDVNVKNPESLEKITIAIPKNKYQKPSSDEKTIIEEDDKYYYLIIQDTIKEKSFNLGLVTQ